MDLLLNWRAKKYLGLKIDKENHAKQLREALGGIKGPIMKIAQILSTIPDLLPITKFAITWLVELFSSII